MDSSKLSFKFFLADGSHFDSAAIVPLFHSWIQKRTVQGHLLIDVAEYDHVQNGPGTVLVAHEGNFSTDLAIGGAPGLLYMRKQPLAGDLAARIRQTLKITLQAVAALETETKLKFRADNPLFRIYDRLEAPNTAATFDAVKGALQTTLDLVYGSPVKLHYKADEQGVFEIRIASVAMSATNLLGQL